MSPSETQYICAKCNINIVTQKGLNLHMKSNHSNAIHTCTNCGRNFTNNQKLMQHLASHTKSGKGKKVHATKLELPSLSKRVKKKKHMNSMFCLSIQQTDL